VDLLTNLLVGTLIEVGMSIARTDNPAAARAEAGEVIELLLGSLKE
jgi:hypothetical protein